MAGRGPAPGTGAKSPETRRRRNRPRQATTLSEGHEGRFPALPATYRTGEQDAKGRAVTARYLAVTREWYETFCQAPEASQFSDVDSLYLRDVVAPLYDRGVRGATVVSELRLQLAQFGATPLAKKSLGWALEKKHKPPEASRRESRWGHMRVVDDAVAGS